MPASRACIIEIEARGLDHRKPHRLNAQGQLGPVQRGKEPAQALPAVEQGAVKVAVQVEATESEKPASTFEPGPEQDAVAPPKAPKRNVKKTTSD